MRDESTRDIAMREMLNAIGPGGHEVLRYEAGAKAVFDVAVRLLAEAMEDGRYRPSSREEDERREARIIRDAALYENPLRADFERRATGMLPGMPHPDDREAWELRTGFSEDDFS